MTLRVRIYIERGDTRAHFQITLRDKAHVKGDLPTSIRQKSPEIVHTPAYLSLVSIDSTLTPIGIYERISNFPRLLSYDSR